MFIKTKKWTVLSIVIIIPIGILCKFYDGPASVWVSDSLGGVFYVIVWCLLIFLIFSKMRPIIIVSLVFVITCLLEFLQLLHPSFLEFFRSFFIGRTILGTSFTWSDFPYYFIGCVISYFWIKLLKKLNFKNNIHYKKT